MYRPWCPYPPYLFSPLRLRVSMELRNFPFHSRLARSHASEWSFNVSPHRIPPSATQSMVAIGTQVTGTPAFPMPQRHATVPVQPTTPPSLHPLRAIQSAPGISSRTSFFAPAVESLRGALYYPEGEIPVSLECSITPGSKPTSSRSSRKMTEFGRRWLILGRLQRKSAGIFLGTIYVGARFRGLMRLVSCWTTNVSNCVTILFLALNRTSLVAWEGNGGIDQVKPYNQGELSTSHSHYISHLYKSPCPADSIGVSTIGVFQ